MMTTGLTNDTSVALRTSTNIARARHNAAELTPTVILGRKVLWYAGKNWQQFSRAQHEQIGRAEEALESIGLSWQDFTNEEEVLEKGEAIRKVAEHKLVTEFGLPVSWFVGVDGMPVGANVLDGVTQACELAEQLGEDPKSWPVRFSVTHVATLYVRELLTRLEDMHRPPEPTPAPVNESCECSLFPGRKFRDLDELEQALITRGKATAIANVPERKLGAKAAKRATAIWKAKASTKAKPAPTPKVEAKPAEPAPVPTVETIRFTPGMVIDFKGEPHVVCSCDLKHRDSKGREVSCRKLVPLKEARVAKSLANLAQKIGAKRPEDVNHNTLAPFALCERCATCMLPSGSQTVAQAVEVCAKLYVDSMEESNKSGRMLAASLGLENLVIHGHGGRKTPVRLSKEEYEQLGRALATIRLAGVDGRMVATLPLRQRTVQAVIALAERRLGLASNSR